MTTQAGIEERLLRRYHVDGDLQAREELIAHGMGLVRAIARRYDNRGEPFDDLVQAGAMGLIKAVDRFDIERGARFSTFAVPNIAGEIKRHFRDRGWTIRVPRDVQELAAKITPTTDRLTGALGRSPTVLEIAEALKTTEEAVLEAMQGARHYNTVSFEEPVGEDRTALDVLGADDEGYATAERRVMLERGMSGLDERERRIVSMYFFEDQTQREIAEVVGVSQMHVSRLLRRALSTMRQQIEAQPAARNHLRRVA